MQENETKKSWYDKSYKLILIIPAALALFSIIFLFQFFSANGDIILKDVSITGGTTVTVFETVDLNSLRQNLEPDFPDILVRGISDIRTGEQQGFFVETTAPPEEIRPALEGYLGFELTQENSSLEFSGSAISEGFYQQLRLAMLIAFVFMAIVVFIIFRSPVPSLAVILAALADIVLTITLIDLFGMSLSIGGIVALLMLIGYSVDTDILLTTRVLRKRQGTLNERIFEAFKTGMTMTLTSIIAVGVALAVIFNFSDTLRQMFTILLIGLVFDLIFTWTMNASILKWYAEVKKIR